MYMMMLMMDRRAWKWGAMAYGKWVLSLLVYVWSHQSVFIINMFGRCNPKGRFQRLFLRDRDPQQF
jgi:hypothetical protein